jgi:zinc transporter ZupT
VVMGGGMPAVAGAVVIVMIQRCIPRIQRSSVRVLNPHLPPHSREKRDDKKTED